MDKAIKDNSMDEIRAKQQPPTIPAPGPICPFMSSPEREVSCSNKCRLFRNNRPGYECYIQELQSISWNTRKPRQQQYGEPPPTNQY